MIVKFKIQISKFKITYQNLKCLKKFWILICGFTFWILNFKFIAFAQPISSTELINNARQYDGKTVVYEGEVIGEVMTRGDYAWLNVNDGENAIGIWLNSSLARGIIYAGSYKTKGDRVEVTGLFNRACALHGGDLDIHTLALRKINTGRPITEQLNTGKRNQALVLLVLLCLMLILLQLKKAQVRR